LAIFGGLTGAWRHLTLRNPGKMNKGPQAIKGSACIQKSLDNALKTQKRYYNWHPKKNEAT
jgi:hypothetical protein